MEDKIIKEENEFGEVEIQFKNGITKKVLSKTTYIHYESGRKDCKVEVEPIDSNCENVKLGGN